MGDDKAGDIGTRAKGLTAEALVPGIKAGPLVVLPVVEPRIVQAVFADLIVEARRINQGVAISLAYSETTGDAPEVSKAVVCARLRLDLPTAHYLRDLLGTLLTDVPPPPKSEVN